jgi:hypothetical protein
VIPIQDLRRRIASAEASLISAVNQWDAADLPRCQECRTLLKSSIEELEGAQSIAEKHLVMGAADLSIRIDEIRFKAMRMIRIVDASTAFCRGMSARIGAGESDCATSFENRTPVSTQG